MKPVKYILIIATVLSLTSCKKGGITQFDMDYEETFTIPSSVGVNLPFNVSSPDIESNSESEFEINDTRKDKIEQIILKSCKLTVTSPSNGDFSFLDEIHIYLDAEGLSEIEIAWKENIPDNQGTQLDLDLSGADMQEYIKKDKFSLRLNTVTDEIITSDYEIRMNSVFFVDAKIIG